MGHDHHHDHGDASAYYTEQLFNIAVCGVLGAVMVLMYFNGMVSFLFGKNNPEQHMRVLLGGAGLLAIVLVRAGMCGFPSARKRGHLPTITATVGTTMASAAMTTNTIIITNTRKRFRPLWRRCRW